MSKKIREHITGNTLGWKRGQCGCFVLAIYGKEPQLCTLRRTRIVIDRADVGCCDAHVQVTAHAHFELL